MENNAIIIRTNKEDGSTEELTLEQAKGYLEGYWIESRIKKMLLEGTELFTPYANYKMKIPKKRTAENTKNIITLVHPLYVSPMKERNIEKYGEWSDMCHCCGKRMTEKDTKMVHMNTFGEAMHISIITEDDALKHGFQSQGYFPIGNSCAKKMPKQFIF